MSALIDQLQAIVNQLRAAEEGGGGSETIGEAWRHETGFPKPVLISGVYFVLKEPINPKWRPGMSGQIYGGAFSGGPPRYLDEPSNGDGSPSFPRRSSAGYPMAYGVSGHMADGSPILVGPGLIHDVDGNYSTDADVESARAQMAARQGTGGSFSPGGR